MADLSHVEGPALSTLDVQRQSATIAGFAASRPERVALVLGAQRMTYAALDRQVRAAIAFFRDAAIEPGERVAYLGANRPMFIAVMLACLRSGLVLVPVNWRLSAREIGFVLADSNARLVLADGAFLDTAAQANAAGVAIVRIDGDGAGDLPALLAAVEDRSIEPVSDWELPGLLLYTSGTTGQPKGVQISERAITLARQIERDHGGFDDWGEDEVLLSPLPLFHIGGISWALCGLDRGATVVLTHDVTPAALLDLCLGEGVTRTFMVPQLVRGLIEEMVRRGVRPEALKGIHYGAAPMDPPLLQRGLETIGCRFLQYFGMTEMSGTITILAPGEHDLARPQLLRSVGRALPGSVIEIRDPAGAVVERGTAGEIWTRGPTMMLGYANRPDLTAEAIVAGWYRTGDGGQIDAEGFITLTDRIKDMVVTGGENVYPAEVEAVLREHPAVADCAIYGLPDPLWGERVCAAVELRASEAAADQEIIAFLKTQIAGFKVPKQVEFVDALPRTASGKVQRSKVRQAAMETV